MSYFQVLANVDPHEGTLSGSPVAITFPWRSRKLVIINDSTTNSMTVTFNTQGSITLKTGETLVTSLRTNTVTINGTGLYRLWAFG